MRGKPLKTMYFTEKINPNELMEEEIK